jgi:NAD(P)-dependent dehydrogenase (short-subunit alcohol dehydrogenase family)
MTDSMTGRLAGKTAIITGAGQGIGAATAVAFAKAGARVVVAEVNAHTGQAMADALESEGHTATFLPVDISDAASVTRMVGQAERVFGPADILINNAGINVAHEPLALTDEDWRRCFAVDLEGAWHCTRAVLPAMLAKGAGSIVNIVSVHSFKIVPHFFPYPVAKHALLGMTRALGIEYADRGIRVNAIAPGMIWTPIADAWWATFPDPDAERQRSFNLHPPRRIGRPEEVAMTALFLASDEAPFINAECIVIDGGRSVLYHD